MKLDKTGNFVNHYGKSTIESVVVLENKVVVTYRHESMLVYTSNPPQKDPDTLEEQTWEIVEGKLKPVLCRMGKERTNPATKEVVWDA